MSDGNDRALLPFDADDGNEGSGRLIRRQWHDERWFFSVVDVVALLSESADPGNYWAQLKRRVQNEGFRELVTKCHQLKMRSLDGKRYATDAADVETMLRIVQSIPSKKAEPVKQWLAKVGTEQLEEIAEGNVLAGLDEDQQRLFIRGLLADRNQQLAETAQDAGVLSHRDFAIFQDWGYRGLYNGETARDIAARKELKRGQRIVDWMGSTELAANLFKTTQTEEKLRREGITGKTEANQMHFEVGRKVRHFIVEDLGGTPPEQLPTPAASIQELQRNEQKRLEAERQPSLFPNPEAPRDDTSSGDDS